MKKLINKILEIMPKKLFSFIYMKLYTTKYVDILNKVYMKRLLKSELLNNFDEFIQKVKVKKKYAVIKYGDWNYSFFNFCYLTNVLGLIVYCIDNGYIPIIESSTRLDSKEKLRNIWDDYFVQPFNSDQSKVKKAKIICLDGFFFNPDFRKIKDKKFVEFWHKVYKEFVVLKPEIKKYFDDEYNKLISDKKVLGCICRGTDYIALRPSGHPKQPLLSDVLSKVDDMICRYNIDYIYLATEEKSIQDEFYKRFPDKVIINKRVYYDEIYNTNENIESIGQVHFDRDNDNFLKGIEYFSSINLLSKCEYLTGGWCGGTGGAIFMNGYKYKVCDIFDLGFY